MIANLLLLALVAGLVLKQQTRNSLESFLYAPARERIRDLGRVVEEEFPRHPASEQTAWLAQIEKPYGATLAVYDDQGTLVAGPDLKAPAGVMTEISRPRRERPPRPEEENRGGPGRPGPPMFMIPEVESSRYWVGYYFPISRSPEYPPIRHTLVLVAPSFMGLPLLVDWTPWLIAASVALLLTIACWAPLVKRLTESIDAVRSASAEIAEGRFDVKIPLGGHDEFADLAHSVKRMAEQLSQLVHGQKRFLADVAHELCAPLSRIQLSAGILEQQATNDTVESVRRLERDVAQMAALVGDLLSFTKGAARKPELGPVALAQLVDRVVAREVHAENRVSSIVVHGTAAVADQAYLERAVGNVVRNAIRYAGEGGPIHIRSEMSGDRVRLVVADCGPGLPEGDLDAIFSPFHRPDTVRTPGTGGVGLGLAIVKACVEACQGTVSCRNRAPVGLEVVIELKAARFA